MTDKAKDEGYQNILSAIADAVKKLLSSDDGKPKLLPYEDYVKQFGPKAPNLEAIRQQEIDAIKKRLDINGVGANDNALKLAAERAQRTYDAQLKTYQEQLKAMPEAYRQYAAAFQQQRETERVAEDAKPFAERNPGIARTLPVVGMTAAALATRGMASRQVRNYNDAIADLSRRAGVSAEEFHKAMATARPGAEGTAEALLNAARQGEVTKALVTQYEALLKAGVPGSQAAMAVGCGLGDAALLFPLVMDYSASRPGSELRRKTMESLDLTKPEIYSRFLAGCAIGLTAGKGAHEWTVRRGQQFHPSHASEAEAIKRALAGDTEVIDSLREFRAAAERAAAGRANPDAGNIPTPLNRPPEAPAAAAPAR